MSAERPLAPPGLAPELRPIIEAPFPRFSAAEMTRRRDAIAKIMAEAEIDHLAIYGMNRTGNIVQYLTQWPVLTEAAGVTRRGGAIIFISSITTTSRRRAASPKRTSIGASSRRSAAPSPSSSAAARGATASA